MTDRRLFLASALGVLGAPALAQAAKRPPEGPGAPDKPSIVEGKPPKLDYGDDLQIPLNKNAFATLWEAKDRWITFGLGLGRAEGAAMAKATKAADLTMQLLLITLAFQPSRLVQVDGKGWRPKTGRLGDLVLGELYLPGKAVRPVSGRYMSGDEFIVPDDPNTYSSFFAATRYQVMKAEMSLDWVRAHARIAPLTPGKDGGG